MLRLRELRTGEDLTQKQLAEKIGYEAHNIGDWERGKAEPSIRDLIHLADAFEISIDELVGRENTFSVTPSPRINEREKELLSLFRGLNPKDQLFIFDCLHYASLAKKQ